MVKFRKISQIEHGEYPFEDAVVDVDVLNGAFGDVSEGKFEIKPINIEGKYDGCSFCSYKDICFKRPGDINYQYIKKKEGDENE